MKTNIVRSLKFAAIFFALLDLLNTVSAQDSHWNGTQTNTLWSDPNNWNPAGVPPPGDAVTTFTGNVWLDPSPVDGGSVITIQQGDVENPGVGNTNEVFNTIFGPEYGVTLDIYGTLNFDWTLVPWQEDPTPGLRSHINMYSNAVMSTTGASLNLGDGWWTALRQGPYVTVNLYGNASYASLGTSGLWLGGHLNLYDNSSFAVDGYVNMDNAQACNDGTRSIVIGGGTLKLPEGTMDGAGNSGSVDNWVQRGILRAFGKGGDTNDLVVTDDGTNTIVTTVPLGGALQRVYFQPLLLANVTVGTFQQATLSGDYPSVSGVLLSSSEPGVNPATFSQPVYTSSNPKVATIDGNGLVTAVGPGTAQLTGAVGALNGTNMLLLTVTPVVPNLVHRYSFNETSGTTSADLVAGNSPTWDATLNGGANLGGGQVALDGSSGYVQLPAGILTGLNEVTIETWATFGTPINTWANLFAFGDADSAGAGQNYITMQPHNGSGGAQMNFGQGDPGNAGERDAVINNSLDGGTNIQVVAVYHPLAGYEALYTNGVLAASISMFNNLIDPVASSGPTFNNSSILAYTLGADPGNYIGVSLYSTDPLLNASINEFRIYNTALTPAQIMADYALGPNQMLGTSTDVPLNATSSGGNLILQWPTTSSLVNLESSPLLGAGAVWIPANGTISVVGGNYQLTVPMTASSSFFRLAR